MPTIPVHPLAPVDLHPDSLAPFEKALNVPGSPGATILQLGKAALTSLYAEAAMMHDAGTALRDVYPEGDKHPDAKFRKGEQIPLPEKVGLEYASALDAAMHRAGAACDSGRKAVEEHIGTLRNQIDRALKHSTRDTHSTAAASSDIRRWVAGTNHAGAKRADGPDTGNPLSRASSSISEGDLQVWDAIASAPPQISGLTREQFRVLRDLAERKFAGPIRDQLDAANKVLAAIENAGQSVLKEYSSLRPRLSAPRQRSASALERLKMGANSTGVVS